MITPKVQSDNSAPSEREYLPRVVDQQLSAQLQAAGAVLIEGPKWCGKSWTGAHAAHSAIYLQDPDRRNGYLQAAQTQPSLLLRGETPRLLDEWQTVPVLWDAVRHQVDQRQTTGQFILTGSAVPHSDSMLHTGTGRIARLRMRPMSLWESGDSSGEVSLRALFAGVGDSPGQPMEIGGFNTWDVERLAVLLTRGGWPSALKLTDQGARLQIRNYLDAVAEHDVSRVDQVERNPARVRAVLRSIARNTTTEANKSALLSDLAATDVTFSAPTLTKYLISLERLFLLEPLPAWNPALRSRTPVRTNAKWHLVDPSLAAGALGVSAEGLLTDFETFGYLFESLCLRDMRIYAEANDGQVFHYRDKSNLESDMVVVLRDGRWGAVEVKMGAGGFEQAAQSLQKFTDRVDHTRMRPPSFHLILSATEYAHRRPDGTIVCPLGCLRP